jgi:hypothetical protein
MAHRWVVRTKLSTMKAVENVAHLVAAMGVLRAAPSLCGAKVAQDEFWETAETKTKVCPACKPHLKRLSR